MLVAPMKRSSITPAMFMATPCNPVGSPNRKSARMMSQSGFQFTPRKSMTQAPLNSFQIAYAPTIPLESTVPMAAPRVPNAGTGPKPRMNNTLNTMLPTVTARPSLSGVRASPAERSAPPSMKKSIIPKPNTNMMRRNGNDSLTTAGVAFTRPSSHGAAKYPRGANTPTDITTASRKACEAARLTPAASSAPAKRAISTPIPLNSDARNTMTTKKSCRPTPIPALPAKPTK